MTGTILVVDEAYRDPAHETRHASVASLMHHVREIGDTDELGLKELDRDAAIKGELIGNGEPDSISVPSSTCRDRKHAACRSGSQAGRYQRRSRRFASGSTRERDRSADSSDEPVVACGAEQARKHAPG